MISGDDKFYIWDFLRFCGLYNMYGSGKKWRIKGYKCLKFNIVEVNCLDKEVLEEVKII